MRDISISSSLCILYSLSYSFLCTLSKTYFGHSISNYVERINQKLKQIQQNIFSISMKGGKNSKQLEMVRSLQNELEEKKKQCLELTITLRSLENKNAILAVDHKNISQQFYSLKQVTDDVITNQKYELTILEDRLKELLAQKRQIRIKYDTLKVNHDALTIEYDVFKQSTEQQIEALNKKHNQELQQYQNSQTKYKAAFSEHQKLIKQINQVKQCKEKQKQLFMTKIADKERQKIQCIDSIKKQMLNRAVQMRNKALQIRKQQLQITTRLTFLQNDQLVRELQYQSNQTEQMLKKNSLLQAELKQMKRQIQIHEGVEKQIVKRNVLAKNMISSLTQQLNKNQVAKKSKSLIKMTRFSLQQPNKSPKNFRIQQKQKEKEKVENQPKKTLKNIKQQQQECQNIYFLKQAVQNLKKANDNLSKQLREQKQKNISIKAEYQDLQKKVGLQNSNDIAFLINKYYEQFLKNNNLVEKDGNNCINQQELKKLDVQKWPNQVKENAIKLIMNSLRPYLATKVVKLPCFRAKNKTKSLDYQILKQNNCTSKYVQALKRHQSRNIEKMKDRSVTYIIDDSFSKSKLSGHRRVSTTKINSIVTQPVAKRFLKPHFINRN